jgi:hypothetical protein
MVSLVLWECSPSSIQRSLVHIMNTTEQIALCRMCKEVEQEQRCGQSIILFFVGLALGFVLGLLFV